MSDDKKPRGDSKLDALNGQQQALLSEWLTVENLTYAKARERVREQFGITTTRSALCSFYARVAAPWKYARAAGEADQFADLMEGKFDAATIKRTKQLAFEALTSPTPDIKAAKALLKIVGDSAKIDLQRQTLAHAIEKFREDVKSSVEKGLDALEIELKGNAAALELFAKMKAVVRDGMEAAK